MKPDSIRKFDWLYLASIVAGLLGIAIGWDTMTELVDAQLTASGAEGMGEGLRMSAMIGVALLGAAISFALWFLISALRVELIKWILILMVAWTLVTMPASFAKVGGFGPMHVPGAVSTILTIAAIWFLFRPDAKAWFAEKRGSANPD